MPPYNCKGSSDGAVLYAKIVREKKFTNNIWFGRDNHPCPKKINEAIEAMRKSQGEIEFIFIDHLLNEDRFDSLNESKDKYQKLLEKVQILNANLVAKWMGVGFIHGVMNTDNISICG